MIDFLLFILIGFIVSIPIGPTTLLAFRRTIKFGFKSGLATGMGLVITDLVYSIVTVSGATLLIDIIKNNATVLKLLGLLIIFAIAIVVYKSKLDLTKRDTESQPSLVKSFFTVFSFSIFNPASLILFLSFIASGLINDTNKIIFPLGIFIGELAWWILINKIFEKYKDRIKVKYLKNLNKVIAVLLMVLAVFFFLL